MSDGTVQERKEVETPKPISVKYYWDQQGTEEQAMRFLNSMRSDVKLIFPTWRIEAILIKQGVSSNISEDCDVHYDSMTYLSVKRPYWKSEWNNRKSEVYKRIFDRANI